MKRFVVLALAFLLLTGFKMPSAGQFNSMQALSQGCSTTSGSRGAATINSEWEQEARRRERDEILARAEQGDAEAQFQLYTRDKPDGKSLTWLCLAANQGHTLAQEELGDLHVLNLGQAWREAGLVKLDRVRAYMWHSLAAANSDGRAGYRPRPLYIRDNLADQMSPAQIAEAERLAAEWKPGDCGAEGSPTKPTG